MKPEERRRQLLHTLTRGCIAAHRLCNQLEASVRTIYRDVAELRRCGYRIRSICGGRGGFWLDRDSKPAPVELSIDELREVVLALTQAASRGALVSLREPRPLIDKLLASVAEERGEAIDNLIKTTPVYPSRPLSSKTLDALEIALHEDKTAIVFLEAGRRPKQLAPRPLYLSPSGWCLATGREKVEQILPLNQVLAIARHRCSLFRRRHYQTQGWHRTRRTVPPSMVSRHYRAPRYWE